MDCNFICPAPCDALPEVSFSLCNPVIVPGQVSKIFISAKDHPLLDETDPNEWAARISLATGNAAKIIVLNGVGDKPVPELNDVVAAYNEHVYSNKLHSVNFSIRELPDLNYNMAKYFESTGKALVWYESGGGKTYGGKGILARINFDQVIPESLSDLEMLTGTIKWDNKLHPCRNDSVI